VKDHHGLIVCTALRIEALAARGSGRTTVRVGMGPRRAAAAVPTLPGFDALAVAGFGGALTTTGPRPGDLFVATEVRAGDRRVSCPWASTLLSLLDEAGLPACGGPLVTHDRIATGPERSRLAVDGALAVDMEAAPLAAAANGRPFVVIRAIVDTPDLSLARPGTVYRGLLALHRLRQAVPLLLPWAARSTGRPATSPAKETRPT
jgi:4-hydroxy-3-methylbut-2-enyl diphosphate reductase